MTISFEETDLPGVRIIHTNRHFDERGFFTETYKESDYLEIGIPRFVQDNMSESSKGVIRGLHWQSYPNAQGKLITCIYGSILDVVVDIRQESRTFGNFFAIELNSKQQKSLWVPEGFAHGFQALGDGTRVQYKVTNYWNQASEKSLNALDPDLRLPWILMNPIFSEKDARSPFLREISK
jgi:dTDP-4-dehydrorhamnose 3,5-epimerase